MSAAGGGVARAVVHLGFHLGPVSSTIDATIGSTKRAIRIFDRQAGAMLESRLMEPAQRATRLRSRLIRTVLLVAGVAALIALAAATLTFAEGLETAASGLDEGGLDGGLEQALHGLGRTRLKLERAERKLDRAHEDVRQLERKLERTSQLSATRARKLGKIRGAAGGELPLTDDPCGLNLTLAAAPRPSPPDAYEIHCPGPGLDWNGLLPAR